MGCLWSDQRAKARVSGTGGVEAAPCASVFLAAQAAQRGGSLLRSHSLKNRESRIPPVRVRLDAACVVISAFSGNPLAISNCRIVIFLPAPGDRSFHTVRGRVRLKKRFDEVRFATRRQRERGKAR